MTMLRRLGLLPPHEGEHVRDSTADIRLEIERQRTAEVERRYLGLRAWADAMGFRQEER